MAVYIKEVKTTSTSTSISSEDKTTDGQNNCKLDAICFEESSPIFETIVLDRGAA